MLNFKEIIANAVSDVTNIDSSNIIENIEVPKDKKQGDYAFPCFRLAKDLKKAPQIIAQEIVDKIKFEDNLIDKKEVVGGYINFFVNKETLVKTVIEEVKNKKEEYRKIKCWKWKKHSYRLFIS